MPTRSPTPATKQRAKPATKQSTKPATKQSTKPATKQSAKPATKQSAKPVSKQSAKPATKQSTTSESASSTGRATSRALEFTGFPKAAIDFLRELESNNHRDWFTAHKSRYEQHLKRPFEALASDLEPELGSAKVFRIYNDVRFAKGKPPYKTHGSVVFENRFGLVHYVHLEKEHLFVATGMHAMLPDQIKRFLDAAIDPKHGARLAKAVKNAESDGLEIGGEVLKTVARGYPKDHSNARFLRHKGLTTSVRFELAPWMHEPAAVDRMRDVFARSAEVNEWLVKHVGRSEDGARWVKH